MFTFRGAFTNQIWLWKGGFQLMQILGLLGMYFDAVVVFVTNSSLLFRLAVAILWFALFQECWSVHAANIYDRIFVMVLSYIFFYFKVPNVRMYLLNPFLKLVMWKKCRTMPWQKSLFFIYIFFILQSTFGWNTCDMWISHDIFDRGTSTCTFAQSQISRKIQRWVFSSVYRYVKLRQFNFNLLVVLQ